MQSLLSSCGEPKSQVSLISSAPAGATPAPATTPNPPARPVALKEQTADAGRAALLGAMQHNIRAPGFPSAATSSGVGAPLRLTAAQHNTFPKGRW